MPAWLRPTYRLDRYEIDPTEDFTKKIEAALQKAKLVIMILSPNWARRSHRDADD
jgi:hypothetical protein